MEALTKKLEMVKTRINDKINSLFDDIAKEVQQLDAFIIPQHGIPFPEKENPMNLFKRQLKIEELSFELAHNKYQQSLNELIKIGRADQLASSHRYIIGWMRSMERAITEQQKIFIKRGGLDSQKSKMGYYFIQMPSDKMAAICVMHLMKLLFSQFSRDSKNVDEFSLN
mmetsp:Transcript_41821/g.63938  ORF Transcript_41821/g.63938 Transcript_41821/m.63938 type:complete len:169 (+) Transcript_41821:1103-1609(+)